MDDEEEGIAKDGLGTDPTDCRSIY